MDEAKSFQILEEIKFISSFLVPADLSFEPEVTHLSKVPLSLLKWFLKTMLFLYLSPKNNEILG